MLGHPRDLLVISQPILRAISPKVLYESSHLNSTIYLKVQEPLVSFVNYTCFLYSDGKLLGLLAATQINNRMLRCPVYQNQQYVAPLGSKKYSIALSGRQDVAPV